MHIHFVCTGNAYRSRLAEAYLKSKLLPGVMVSSTGTEAKKHYFENGPISWMAMRLIQKNNLIPFMKPMPETTTLEMLMQADLIIYFTKQNYEYAKQYLGYSKSNYQIWEILDLDKFSDAQATLDDERQGIEVTEKTFEQIKKNVNALVKEVVNKSNSPKGTS